MVVNAGDAEINGAEIDISFLPFDGLDLGFNASFLDAKLTQDLILPPDTDGFEAVLALDGARLPISPELKYSAYAQYTSPRELFGGHVFGRLQYSYNGDALNNLECNAPDCTPHQVMHSYSIADAKIGIEGADGDWEVSLFVDNLTDEHAELYKFEVPPGAITVNRPREYGIRFMKKWSRSD
jgi:outer membrane receptor protein involved in Fe transport